MKNRIMKDLVAGLSLLVLCTSGRAIANSNCNFNVESEDLHGEPGVKVRIDEATQKIWGSFVIPSRVLPLKEGTDTDIPSGSFYKDDTAHLTYENGVLEVTVKLRSNFTVDTFSIAIDPDLSHPKSASYSRRGVPFFWDHESFDCKF